MCVGKGPEDLLCSGFTKALKISQVLRQTNEYPKATACSGTYIIKDDSMKWIWKKCF